MYRLAESKAPKGTREIIATRLIDSPRDVVWKVLTTPDLVKHCWGPDGFTNTIAKMDVRDGGEWLFTMHGPDGVNYPNRQKFDRVEQGRLMAGWHDGGDESPPKYRFYKTVELKDEAGKTRVTFTLRFGDEATRDEVAAHAIPGGEQNLNRLAAFVAPLANPKNRFVIERVFNVPQKRLFEACTARDELVQWLAPAGTKVIKAAQDFRVGGTYHYGMEAPQGMKMWGLMRYLEITPFSRLVYLQSFSDKHGGLGKHPMAPHWPAEMHGVFDFIALGPAQTKLKISWTNAGIDDAASAAFQLAHDSMTGGWTGSLNMLEAHLGKT